MAKKWRYVQKSIYICIFHILQCIWVLWMWSKYGDYVAFEQIVNNKCLSLAFDLNKVNKFAKPICPLALSELEFPKKLYIFTQLKYWNWITCPRLVFMLSISKVDTRRFFHLEGIMEVYARSYLSLTTLPAIFVPPSVYNSLQCEID